MIVIVEGIDRVGKTTFCEALAKDTGWPIYKHDNKLFDYSEMDDKNEVDKMLQLLDVIDQLDVQLDEVHSHGLIFDRFHLSNLVYGFKERDYDLHDGMVRLAAVEERLQAMRQKALLVMLYDRAGTYRASIEHGKDLKGYQFAFDKLYECAKMPKIRGTLYDVPDMVEAVVLASENLEGAGVEA